MSLPISSAALITTGLVDATRLAGSLAGRVGEAIGFSDVLRGEPHDAAADEPATLTADLVKAIRRRLTRLGIDANQPLRVRVTQRGGLRVDQSHPRAAEIESALSSDSSLVDQARQLHRATGVGEADITVEIPVDLTSQGGRENIKQTSGGYPNW